MPDAFPFFEKPEDYLKLEIDRRVQRRPSYSLRAFARDLGMSPSSLSEFLTGKTGISVARARTLSKKLSVSGEHIDHFVDLVVSRHGNTLQQKEAAQIRCRSRLRQEKSRLALDQFKIISDWYHFAILELVVLDPAYQNMKKLAKAVGVSAAQVEKALGRLEQVRLIDRSTKPWKVLTQKTEVGEGIASLALQEFHRQILGKAAEALTQQSISEREFQSTVMSIDTKDLPEFKSELKKALSFLIDKYHGRAGINAVYALSTQLFQVAGRVSILDQQNVGTRVSIKKPAAQRSTRVDEETIL